MAQLPTSLNIHQPNISDGSDLLRMAALLSRESSESANKAFDDFKSTMKTSANNDLASTFANGIANGLSPDEAFKQASGTINSWTSADAINSALQTRNAEKDAILRANQDRRAEAFENRAKLDWEGANKAAEANNLFNLAHATNNMDLFNQAKALTQGYDDITKKHVKPTEMATLQDSLATNALQRAKAQVELENAKQERLAKLAQARYHQLKANNPDKSTYMPLEQVAKEFGTTPEKLQELGLYYGLTMGTETAQERQDTVTSIAKYTPTDAQNKANWSRVLADLDVTLDESNSLMLTPDAKLSESDKAKKQRLLNMLSGNLESDMKDLDMNEMATYITYMKNGAISGTEILPKPEDLKQFTNALLQTTDKKSRDALIDSFANQYVMADTVKSKINSSLNKNFKYTDNSSVSLSDTAYANYTNALNTQDLGGQSLEETKNLYKLSIESNDLKERSANNAKRLLVVQDLYSQKKYAEAEKVMAEYKAEAEKLQKDALKYEEKWSVATLGNSLVTTYRNYSDIINGNKGFNEIVLKATFGEKEASTMLDTYRNTVKEINKSPALQIPDEAIRAAIIFNPTETDEDKIIKMAKVLKAQLPAIKESSTLAGQSSNYKFSATTPAETLYNQNK